MVVHFRNLDVSWSDPIDLWPYEAVVTTIERGLVSDWQPILRDVRERPWGRIASYVEHYTKNPDDEAAGVLFAAAVAQARKDREAQEREAVAARVRRAIEASGVSATEFAGRIGTSASRLSTYANGHVIPSAAMLVRIEREAQG
jgi:DNA-binding transcriptional regulator YiaG